MDMALQASCNMSPLDAYRMLHVHITYCNPDHGAMAIALASANSLPLPTPSLSDSATQKAQVYRAIQ